MSLLFAPYAHGGSADLGAIALLVGDGEQYRNADDNQKHSWP